MDKDNIIFITIVVIVVVTSGLLLLIDYFNLEDKNELAGQIGYVDIQTVFVNHPSKEKAENEINDLARDLQLELENKLEDVPKKDHQKLINEYQDLLSQKENKLIDNIISDIEITIKTVAEDNEMKLILKGEDILEGGINMTPLILESIIEQ
ncbi:MAG: hypothetical protein KGY44_04560 [Halanaerobiales bacterium]|nr:hypothetical protein [Halanaerobiales bacterium]